MANRQQLARFGRRGKNLVTVFKETVDDVPVVRVQWREVPGGPRETEQFGTSRDDIRAAKAFGEQTADRLAVGGAAPLPDVSIRALRDAHVAAMVEAWAPPTLRNFNHRWGRFEAYLGRTTRARLVTDSTLDDFRGELRKQGVATNQRSETVKVVKQVFRWARQRKLIVENPIAEYRIKLARGEEKADVPEWAPADALRMDDQLTIDRAWSVSTRWRLWGFIAVAATQGGRLTAMRHIAWADVNLSVHPRPHATAAGVEIPPRSIWWNPKYDKMRDDRIQPLTDPALLAFRVMRLWRREIGYTGPWVFCGGTNATRGVVAAVPAWAEHPRHKRRGKTRRTVKDTPWSGSAFNQALRVLCARCTPPIEWVKGRAAHGFRKLAAGNVAELTGSERAAADWIGDKSVAVVRKYYLKLRAEAQRRVATQLSDSARPRNRGDA